MVSWWPRVHNPCDTVRCGRSATATRESAEYGDAGIRLTARGTAVTVPRDIRARYGDADCRRRAWKSGESR
jgi:hypothetical protein